MTWNILAPIMSPIINKALSLIPDKNARAQAEEELKQSLVDAVNTINLAQIEINKIEAGHKSIFIAGWRPFIGWVCGMGIAWAFLVQPLVVWGFAICGKTSVELPMINVNGLYQLVLAMLGMGGLRTFEKIKGVAREVSPLVEKVK